MSHSSIFGVASPKFKDLDTNEFVEFQCRILKDEPDYKEIMHQSIIDAHREWEDIKEHWTYECEVLLLKLPEGERRDFYLLLDSYENKVVEFYRRKDGTAWGDFRVDEVTPYYLDHPDYPDKIFLRFISTEGFAWDQIEKPIVSVVAIDDDASYPDNTGTFRISRTGDNVGNLTVEFSISGTATAGVDYQDDLGTSAIIPDGQSYVDIVVTPLDTSTTLVKTVIMTLSEDEDYEIGIESAQINIQFLRTGDLVIVCGLKSGGVFPPSYNIDLIDVILSENSLDVNLGRGVKKGNVPIGGETNDLRAATYDYFVVLIYRNAEIGDNNVWDGYSLTSTVLNFQALDLQDDSGDSWVLLFGGVRSTAGIIPIPDGYVLRQGDENDYQLFLSVFDTGTGVTEFSGLFIEVNVEAGWESIAAAIEIKRKSGSPPVEFIWSGISSKYPEIAHLNLPDGTI